MDDDGRIANGRFEAEWRSRIQVSTRSSPATLESEVVTWVRKGWIRARTAQKSRQLISPLSARASTSSEMGRDGGNWRPRRPDDNVRRGREYSMRGQADCDKPHQLLSNR